MDFKNFCAIILEEYFPYELTRNGIKDILLSEKNKGFTGGSVERTCLTMQETQETWFRSLGQEDPLEKEMETHSSILTWEIPWTEEPGGLQSMGLQRVGHD